MTDDNDTDDGTDTTDNGTAPSEALQLYLQTRKEELSENTWESHNYRLKHFIRWCDERNVTAMESLDGKDLHEYRLWRRDDGDLNPVSLHTQLSTLRVFLKFCESIEVVENGLYDKLVIPSLTDGEDVRSSTLSADLAEQSLDYLRTYEYASADHVMMTLLWRTGMRVGALRSLDVADYDREQARLHVQHRPQGGTTLKMGKDGERIIVLRSSTCVVLNDYLDKNRPGSEDEHGRKPLLAFSSTRPAKSTIRGHVHRCTQPCLWNQQCPHDRTMDSCEDIGYGYGAGCPSSVPPHDVRRGAITHWLSQDVPKQVVSDRANVNEDVLDEHYDQRTAEMKAEQRRKYLDDMDD
jgi:site-specific recombinase XerD